MRLSSEQLEQIQSQREAEFTSRLCADLRATAPEQLSSLADAALTKAVSSAVERARSYGIVSGDGIRRFVSLAVLVSPHFDEDPGVRGFLKLADLEPDLKIKLLSDLTAAHLRARVA